MWLGSGSSGKGRGGELGKRRGRRGVGEGEGKEV